MDKIFNKLKPKLRNGDFDWCDIYLNNVQINEQKEDILIGILVATLDYKEHLKNRYIFFKCVENYLKKLFDEEEVLKMLSGLA